MTRRRNESGAVLVEYAFAFPVLLLVVVFTLSILWLTAMKAATGQAAREGARFASTATPPTYRTHPDAAAVADRINDKVALLDLDAANVTIEYAGCPAPCANPQPNTPLTVTVAIDVPGPLRPFAAVFGAGARITTSSNGEVRAE